MASLFIGPLALEGLDDVDDLMLLETVFQSLLLVLELL